ncbi:MAG: phosphoglycerate mutase [Pseudomonadota bacterium]
MPGFLPPHGHWEEFITGLALPALSRLVARGKALSTPADHYEAWLCQRFSVSRQNDWPLAPVTLTTDGGNAENAYWLRADPVHLQANRDQLIMADCGIFNISEDEAISLTDTLNNHFRSDGFIFYPLQPTRWYLRFPSPIDLHCTSRRETAGKNIDLLLPTGNDAQRFRSLLNEAQMLLFAHPLNEARENAGQVPINSVWFWGGGQAPRIERPAIVTLWAKENVARSLASLASIPIANPTADALLAQKNAQGEHLIVLDELEVPRQYDDVYNWQQALIQLEQNWFLPLLKALQTGRIKQLTLTGFGDDRSVEIKITRTNLWKFWRNSRRLTDI